MTAATHAVTGAVAGYLVTGDLAGLRAFLAATPGCRATILAHQGTAAARLGERLWALPLSLLLS